MPPHRNVPSATDTPSTKPIKPERTLRSHEENQERAYIAASRRSDRSLEARVESARRASDIHKKRTGRALRVTEQDVMNEEMYEEEDDDIPWRYRNVTSHLPLEDGLLSRRIQSMLAVQLENQRLLGQAVNSTLQHNPQFASQAQFITPGMMQMPQSAYPNSMLPPQQLNRMASGYRHSPYPSQQGQQQTKPHYHQRSASIATPHELAMQQYHQSMSSSPSAGDERRMSLPQHTTQQRSLSNALQRTLSYTSHHGSAPATPTNQQTIPTSPGAQRQYQQRPSSVASSLPRIPSPNREINNPLAPLTTTLPMDTQQLLAGAENFPTLDMFGPQDFSMKSQQPFYSYKPNVSGGSMSSSSMKSMPNSTTSGLDQTLLGTNIDTSINDGLNVSYVDTPASDGPLNSAALDAGFGYGFDGTMFGVDPLGPESGVSSGHVTPGGHGQGYSEPMFNDFLDSDMFGDVHSGSI